MEDNQNFVPQDNQIQAPEPQPPVYGGETRGPDYQIGAPKNSPLKKYVKIGLVIAVLLAGLNAGIYYWRKYSYDQIAKQAEEGNRRVEEIKAKRQAGAKTYKNEELGFSVAYSGAWRTEECVGGGQGMVAFGQTTEQMLNCQSEFIPVSPVVIRVLTAENFGQYSATLVSDLDNAMQEDITVAGKIGLKVSGTTKEAEGPALPAGHEVVYVVIYANGKIYQLGLFDVVDGTLDTASFNKMIASLKFLQ